MSQTQGHGQLEDDLVKSVLADPQTTDFQKLVVTYMSNQIACLNAIRDGQIISRRGEIPQPVISSPDLSARTTSESASSTIQSPPPMPSSTTTSFSSISSSKTLALSSSHEWDDEQGWSVAMKGAMQRLRERVKMWRDGLDTTLLFIALFSAIITAFLLQTLQNLTITPDQQNNQDMIMKLINIIVDIAAMNGLQVPEVTPPDQFQAARSDEISASVWYTSLVTSIVCAALAAFTKYQMPDLEDIPSEVGQKFIAKVMQIKERTALAKWLLSPTLKAIHWTLIGSIALFMGGLIYQLWNTLEGLQSTVLFATSILDTIIGALLALFMIAVTLHAIFSPESPFETAFSQLLRFASKFLGRRIRKYLRRKDQKKIIEGRSLRGAINRWSEPDPCSAATHFCELVSECDDAQLLNIGAPVLIECLDFIRASGAQSMIGVETAIAQMLRAETSTHVKLMVLRNIRRIRVDRNPLTLTILPRVLLRIQERESSGDAQELAQAGDDSLFQQAFRSMVHLLDPLPETPNATEEPSYQDCILRGFKCCEPDYSVKKKPEITPQFLGALLSWGSLPDLEREAVLERIDLPTWIPTYILAIDWAHQELGLWDHRTRYRVILLDALGPQLDRMVSDYGREGDNDLLSELEPFIAALDDWFDPKRNPLCKDAAVAILSILRHIRKHKKHMKSTALRLGSLTRIIPLFLSRSGATPLLRKDFDKETLENLKTIVSDIRDFQALGWFQWDQTLCQYLVDFYSLFPVKPSRADFTPNMPELHNLKTDITVLARNIVNQMKVPPNEALPTPSWGTVLYDAIPASANDGLGWVGKFRTFESTFNTDNLRPLPLLSSCLRWIKVHILRRPQYADEYVDEPEIEDLEKAEDGSE
ncbi:hypothetical protein SISSUDRAFT_1130881, partial [Sistotremastrum suecicum HHB10207 ss-3]